MAVERTDRGASETGAPPLSRDPGPVARPVLSPGVQLLGEFQGSGYVDRQWLIQRDGRFIQVAELLYRIAEMSNGRRDLDDIASEVTAATEWIVTPDQIRQLIELKLSPLGIVDLSGATETVRRPPPDRSLLSIHHRSKVIPPNALEPIAGALLGLFRGPVVALLLLVALAAHVWLYAVHGIAVGVYDVLTRPDLLLVVVPCLIASGLFHELGHATALRYGGGQARGIGAGFYLVYPTFYTDVSDAYRLDRVSRLRTDLGGMYFHLIFILAMLAVYAATRLEFLLSIVALVDLDLLYQCIPIVRLDGYWALCDVIGVPDLFTHGSRTMRDGAAGRSVVAPTGSTLKPAAQIAVGAYFLLTIPALILVFYEILSSVPPFVFTMGGTMEVLADGMARAIQGAAWIGVIGFLAEGLILVLVTAGMALFLGATAWGALRSGWRWSRGVFARQVGVATGAVGVVAVLGLLWSPWIVPMGTPMPDETQHFSVTQRAHVYTPVQYPQDPPVGGNHWPVWQNCGYYAAPIHNENGVHSLEHGAVWITYRPDLPPTQVAVLHQLARHQSYVLVSPYPGLRTPVVASAWGSQLALQSSSDPRLVQFIHAFALGPQAPERGGPCSGGTGQPLP